MVEVQQSDVVHGRLHSIHHDIVAMVVVPPNDIDFCRSVACNNGPCSLRVCNDVQQRLRKCNSVQQSSGVHNEVQQNLRVYYDV
jgi:hypothetical protein